MGKDEIVYNLAKEFKALNTEMFAAEWRKNITDMQLRKRRYDALLQWINVQIKRFEIDVKILNPADKNAEYTQKYFKQFFRSMAQLGVLVQFRELLQDPKCTSTQAANIEYTIEKMFYVYYDASVDYYLDLPKE